MAGRETTANGTTTNQLAPKNIGELYEHKKIKNIDIIMANTSV